MPFHTDITPAGLQVTVHAPWGHYVAGYVVDLKEEGRETWGGRFMGKVGHPGFGGARKWSDKQESMVHWLVRRWGCTHEDPMMKPGPKEAAAPWLSVFQRFPTRELDRREAEWASGNNSSFEGR